MKSGERTKEKIGSAFKKLMIDRPFDSITITDITDACSLNRLTFYYHFQDKYDLMNWIFYKDVIDPIRGSIDVDNWPDKLYSALTVLKEDGEYYCSSVSYDRVELRTYLFDVSFEVMTEVIRDITKDMDVEKEDIDFFVSFLAHGLSGMMLDWIQGGMTDDPHDIVRRVVSVVDGCKLYGFESVSEAL